MMKNVRKGILVSPIVKLITKKGRRGVRRKAKRKKGPSFLIPEFIVDIWELNLRFISSLSKYLALRNARLAPTVLAIETKIVALISPNIDPPAKVRIVAPGREKPVTRM